MSEMIELAVIQPQPAKKAEEIPAQSVPEAVEDSTKASLSQTEDEHALISVSTTAVSEPVSETQKRRKIWTGNTCAMCYYDGYPLIIIGPHCTYFVYHIHRQ